MDCLWLSVSGPGRQGEEDGFPQMHAVIVPRTVHYGRMSTNFFAHLNRWSSIVEVEEAVRLLNAAANEAKGWVGHVFLFQDPPSLIDFGLPRILRPNQFFVETRAKRTGKPSQITYICVCMYVCMYVCVGVRALAGNVQPVGRVPPKKGLEVL